MEDLKSSVAHSSEDILVLEEENLRASKAYANVSTGPTSDVLQCFVCDIKVQGRHYSLATCRTQSTRARVIEKLGELVGESYMVVISEDDVICRGCANLINSLDRLESEIKSVRGTVLRYLERKYCLNEGELLNNNESVKNSQPPHVTTSDENAKKRKAVNLLDDSACKNKRKKTMWLQCDKCRYTTNYNTFMVHHIRQHVNQKINCDRCGVQFIGNNQQNNSHNCNEKQKQIESSNQGSSTEISTEPIFRTENYEFLENGELTEASLITVQDQCVSQGEEAVEEDEIKVLHLSDPEYLQPDKRETQEDELEQKFNLEQENIDVDSKPILLEETDSTRDFVFQKKDFSTKQILTVAEDGSLKMVEVEAWDEKNANLKEDES